MQLPTVAEHADTIAALAARPDLDLVVLEGAGGLLVRMDGRGGTIADLGAELAARGVRAGFVVVAMPGLGTLNHSALTAEALRHPRAGLRRLRARVLAAGSPTSRCGSTWRTCPR